MEKLLPFFSSQRKGEENVLNCSINEERKQTAESGLYVKPSYVLLVGERFSIFFPGVCGFYIRVLTNDQNLSSTKFRAEK